MNPSTDMVLIIFLSIILITAAAIDWRTQKIPNLLTFPAMAVALAYHGLINGAQGFIFSGQGLLLGIGVLFIPFLMGGMGAGDAKLMGAVGAILGWKAVFGAFLLSAMFGGLYALLLVMITRRHFKGFFRNMFTTLTTFILFRRYIPVSDTAHTHTKQPRLCYGVAIALGTLAYVLIDSTGFQFIC